ncbi:MAG TPA: hypothetical protein VI259_01530 [Gemmatimonadaceae bacterium]
MIDVAAARPTQQEPPRRVEGRVVRGMRERQAPIANQWVILHRVGRDRAGPLDSVRTTPTGAFDFQYRVSGDSDAVYFVSTSYGGVAYYTPPLRAPLVRGDDALLVVFDTTSGPVGLRVGGRHLVIGAATPSGQRPIGEVFDLENDSTVTAVARDSVTPVWSATIPAAATNFQLNTNGELAAGALTRRGTSVGLFAPVSPGIRQVAFTYDLPASAFPLSFRIDKPAGVLEVLVQEPTARVQAPGLRETPAVSAEGRTFRRFLAQDVAAGAMVRVDPPRAVGASRQRVYSGVGVLFVAAMFVALVFALRRRPHRGAATLTQPEPQRLMREIAELDDAFEREADVNQEVRANYEARRATLKSELAHLLAGERTSS